MIGLKTLHTLNIFHRDLKVLPANPERQHLSHQIRGCQTWRFECFEDRQKWITLYPDRDSILCQSWSLEGWTIRFQIRYLVSRMCNLWNGDSWTSFQGRRYGGSLQISNSWSLSSNQPKVFQIASSYYQAYVATKTKITSFCWENSFFCAHSKKDRGTSALVFEIRNK